MRDPQVLTRRADVGRRLREFRRGSGLTQGELSRAVKIGQASLSNYENGKRELPLGVAVNLAGALAISLGDLLDIPGILVVREASMGGAVRALAASPQLLDSVVPPVEAEADDAADATADDADDDGGDDNSDDDDGNAGVNDGGGAGEDDDPDAHEAS